ncbi:MAG: tRNA uridine-5-carboxymethylaminomethyl(34) synthesis enzyme MnmG, partial [Planctomycetes bacterium]|nr:tRNA uridine-5-carboxymethylaminomethyl(34) synthesis enzyme MnmG [Planctomycetota bacterium]
RRQIERFRRLESKALPRDVDYGLLSGLRLEAREKLATIAPRTLGQAARIPGISPADITVLWVHVTGRRRARR